MKHLIITILFAIVSINLIADPPLITKKFEKELSKHFNSGSVKTIQIKKLSKHYDLFFNVFDGNKKIGFVVLTSALGRYDRFDYMIVYSLNKEIELIKILVYRSQYGSEITAKRWLGQFYSKQSSSLKYGSDIQAISGATFSASSLTKNINRINQILKEYNLVQRPE